MIGLYINWDVDSEIINIGGFPLKYYGLLFAAGLLLSMSILKKIYKKEKNKNIFYRCVFFGLCFLFAGLGALILFKSPNFISGIYFKNHAATMKGVINMVCFLFAATAFFSGYYIHPEKEAMQFLIGKVERELKSPEKSLQMEFNSIFANLPEEMFSSEKLIRIKELL